MIELADGRSLEIAVSGPADAPPLLFHHGTPGASAPFRELERVAHDHGLRYVSYSRAGYGRSTRRAGRRVVDVADDMRAVLDHVEADRCVVAGWSGGGPHALATAARLPDRVAGVLSIAGVGPYDSDLDFLAGMGQQNVDEFGLALEGEDKIRPLHEQQGPSLATATATDIIAELHTLLPPVDIAVITDEFGEDLAAQFAQAFEVGVDGWVDDDLAFCAPWGFEPAEVTVASFVWQGELDLMVPFAHGRWLADHLPGTTAHLLPGEGHLSIGVGAAEQMIAELAATLR